MNIVFESFDSIDQLLSVIDTRPQNTVFAGTSDPKSKRKGGSDFSGTDSYDRAVTLARSGWDDPLDQLKDVMRSMNVRTNVTRDKHRPSTGVVGYAPCVPNAIMGLPNSMIMTERTPSKIKAITIVYSPTDTAGASTRSYLQSGVAVLKIIQGLELDGYRVRLQVEFKSSEEAHEYTVGRVTVKDWRQPVDLKKLTFPFANAAMQRRIGFLWMETVPGMTQRGYRYGYGCTIARKMNYDRQLDFYNKNGLLKDGAYFITKQLCEDEHYDADRIMARAGMKLGKGVA